jgi:hypothetical protein
MLENKCACCFSTTKYNENDLRGYKDGLKKPLVLDYVKNQEDARDYIFMKYRDVVRKNNRCSSKVCVCTVQGEEILRDDKYCFSKILDKYTITYCCNQMVHRGCMTENACVCCLSTFEHNDDDLCSNNDGLKNPLMLDNVNICPYEEFEKCTVEIDLEKKFHFEFKIATAYDNQRR